MTKRARKADPSPAFLPRLVGTLATPGSAVYGACHNLRLGETWRMPWRAIDEWLLFMARSGRLEARTEQAVYRLARGSVLLVPPGAWHGIERVSAELPHVVSVRFAVAGNGVEPAAEVVAAPRRGLELESPLVALVAQALRQEQDPAEPDLATGLLHYVIGRLQRLAGAGASGIVDDRVLAVQRYLDENPLARDSVAALAARVHLCPRYFSRRFQQQVGCGPKAYQVRRRLDYARLLLVETGQSVAAVAAALGYGDPYLFSRQFKKTFGVSPSAATW